MRILVLGGCGFIGGHVVRRLLKSGHDIANYDRRERTAALSNVLHEFREEFGNHGALESCISGFRPDTVVHLIWSTLPKSSNDDPCFDISSNLEDSVFLLDLCVRYKVKKIVFMSSGGAIYGLPRYLPIDEQHPTDPLSSYGITKLAVEKYAALYHFMHGLEYVCLRAANPYGPGQSPSSSQGVLAVFADRIMRGMPVHLWGDGTVVRDFFNVEDLAELVLRVLEQNHVGIYNAGSGIGTSLNDLVAMLEEAVGKRASILRMPGRPFDPPAVVLSCAAARQAFGWLPRISIRDGLPAVVDWLRTPT